MKTAILLLLVAMQASAWDRPMPQPPQQWGRGYSPYYAELMLLQQQQLQQQQLMIQQQMLQQMRRGPTMGEYINNAIPSTICTSPWGCR